MGPLAYVPKGEAGFALAIEQGTVRRASTAGNR
jgi:hypothetical protein